MSRKYFQSMTLVSSAAWTNYDDSDLKRWDLPVHQIVGDSSHTLELDREVHQKLQELHASVVHPPREEGWVPGYYSVLFEDPDGIRVEVNHVPGRGHFEPEGRLGV